MSSCPSHIDMLWFDLDDTLWDMSGNSVVCLREIYHECNLSRYFDSPDQWDEIYHRINASLWNRYSRGEISQDFLRSERFAGPLKLVGVNKETAAAISKKLDPLYLSLLGSKSQLISGAGEILGYLSSRGYRMGIVTNGFREVQHNKLRSSEIDSYFGTVILSDDAGINKPAHKFFEFAEAKAGTVSKRNVLVGDNAVTDIEGAINAGWEAIWFNPTGENHDFSSNSNNNHIIAQIRHLEELKTLL